jgi:hypothetical protein
LWLQPIAASNGCGYFRRPSEPDRTLLKIQKTDVDTLCGAMEFGVMISMP